LANNRHGWLYWSSHSSCVFSIPKRALKEVKSFSMQDWLNLWVNVLSTISFSYVLGGRSQAGSSSVSSCGSEVTRAKVRVAG
jgi:hypothetical protein